MDDKVFGSYSVEDVLIYAGIFFLALMVFGILKKLFSKKTTTELSQRAGCKNCGWSGMVSRHAGKCPKCNSPLGDRTKDK